LHFFMNLAPFPRSSSLILFPPPILCSLHKIELTLVAHPPRFLHPGLFLISPHAPFFIFSRFPQQASRLVVVPPLYYNLHRKIFLQGGQGVYFPFSFIFERIHVTTACSVCDVHHYPGSTPRPGDALFLLVPILSAFQEF